MKIVNYLIISTVILFSASVQANSNLEYKIEEGSESAVVDNFLSVMEQKDSNGLSISLSYPSSFTAEELEKDQKGIKDIFHILFKEFGSFSNLDTPKDEEKFYEVGASGGTFFWWALDGAITKKYLYSVNFSKYGKGYIKIFTSNYNNKEHVVALYYGLPIENENSKKI